MSSIPPTLTAKPVPDVPRSGIQFWAIALTASIALAAVGHLLMKAGVSAANPQGGAMTHARLPILIGGLCAYGIGTLLWIFAVSRKEISFLYPLTSANYAVVAIGGMVLFGESISLTRWAGIAIVTLGVILMQRSSAGEQS